MYQSARVLLVLGADRPEQLVLEALLQDVARGDELAGARVVVRERELEVLSEEPAERLLVGERRRPLHRGGVDLRDLAGPLRLRVLGREDDLDLSVLLEAGELLEIELRVEGGRRRLGARAERIARCRVRLRVEVVRDELVGGVDEHLLPDDDRRRVAVLRRCRIGAGQDEVADLLRLVLDRPQRDHAVGVGENQLPVGVREARALLAEQPLGSAGIQYLAGLPAHGVERGEAVANAEDTVVDLDGARRLVVHLADLLLPRELRLRARHVELCEAATAVATVADDAVADRRAGTGGRARLEHVVREQVRAGAGVECDDTSEVEHREVRLLAVDLRLDRRPVARSRLLRAEPRVLPTPDERAVALLELHHRVRRTAGRDDHVVAVEQHGLGVVPPAPLALEIGDEVLPPQLLARLLVELDQIPRSPST